MTIALRQNQANGVANPVLTFAGIKPGPDGDSSDVTSGAGFLVDPTSLDYRVLGPDGTEIIASTAVNLITEKLGEGRFAPTFTLNEAGGGAPEGDVGDGYQIEWTAVIPLDGPTPSVTVVRTTTFRLVGPNAIIPDAYATIEDLRDEGVPTAGVFTDARLKRALELSARLIEKITHRTFRPEFKNVNVDARGGPICRLEEPLIALEEVNFTFTTFSPTDLPVEQGDLRVYNRHIRENLTRPDDRENPRIEFLRVKSTRFARAFEGPDVDLGLPVLFAESQQNINLKGLFGYTDYDGSPMGATPELIRWANIRMAMNHLRPTFRTHGKGGATSGPITKERTRDQQVEYASARDNPNTAGAWTGDSEVDQVLSAYRRPAVMRAV